MKKILTLLAMIAISAMLVMAVSAEVTVTYDLTQEATDDGASSTYVITATLVNPDAAEFQIWYNHIEFDNTIIVPADYYDGSVVDLETNPDYCIEAASYTNRGTTYKATIVDPYWTANGNITTHEFDSYYAETTKIVNKTGLAVFKFYFNFAAGKSEADFTSDSFKIVSARYVDNDIDYYYKREGHEDNMTIINNVVPEAVAITIPVLAGDVVYLQNGESVAITEDNPAYEVPAEIGYVVVNSGKTTLNVAEEDDFSGTFQKTYYINGTAALEAHVNAVVGSDALALRDRTPIYDADKGEEVDKNGMRFQMLSSQSSRENTEYPIVESGFIMTAETSKVIEGAGEDYVLNMAMVNNGFAKKGIAYDTSDGTDIRMDSNDEVIDIRGVFYNIPITAAGVQTVIASRPYYKVGDTYVYGEITKSTLYAIAKDLKENEWDECEESLQDYITEILLLVDGTEIVEEEVIIDIGSLYN